MKSEKETARTAQIWSDELVSSIYSHIQAWTKWPSFQYFCLKKNDDFAEICSSGGPIDNKSVLVQ